MAGVDRFGEKQVNVWLTDSGHMQLRFPKRKQCSIDSTRLAVTLLCVVSEARRPPSPQRHKPALTEFRIPNKQRVAV